MREVVKSAKTIEEAVEAARIELELAREEIEFEVLAEPNKGLFGLLGAKDAKVRVTEVVNPERKSARILNELFNCMKIEVEIKTERKDGYIKVNLTGPDLGVLIGRRGDTLDAIQYYINLAANKNADKRERFVLDIEGYRERREETLSKLAFRLAEKAKRKGKDVILEPMNPHERRIIHTALQNHSEVFTYSEGEEPYRKIVIAPKK
ncbi:MAG: RNA-binding cell elongation regulator Jag/EloR [Thermincola sp.]|jgi:spoIIIJ-associated protein|nr:RNA-binding cell elongation regulator Jag/EloR [Thermincola sp.]MDT3701948.1 RNA-binding cell elongation regulator Jag/EloR [Thermincola sp.]